MFETQARREDLTASQAELDSRPTVYQKLYEYKIISMFPTFQDVEIIVSDTAIEEMHFGFIEKLTRQPRRVNLDLRENVFQRFFSENKDDVLNATQAYPPATLGEIVFFSRFVFFLFYFDSTLICFPRKAKMMQLVFDGDKPTGQQLNAVRVCLFVCADSV